MPYEPDTLYEYGKSGRDGLLAQAAVLEALRDGPIDHRNFDYQPILLEKLPSLKDGDAAIAAVTVRDGEDLVDSSGGLVSWRRMLSILTQRVSSACTTAKRNRYGRCR